MSRGVKAALVTIRAKRRAELLKTPKW